MAAIHVYYQNQYCDEWDERMLDMLPGKKFTSTDQDSRKDTHTRLADIDMPMLIYLHLKTQVVLGKFSI